MPYIDPESRRIVNSSKPITEGELNYKITTLIDAYLGQPTYAGINEVIGVLECAKLELYRRVAAPYEDGKCMDNGDVYTHYDE